MKSLAGLAIIALLAIFGSRAFERKVHVPDLFRRLFSEGLIYLFAGVLLGPAVLGFIDNHLIERFSPVITIGLFWIGFLFGINLKFRDVKRLTPSVFLLTFGQACFVFVVVGALFFWFLKSHIDTAGTLAVVAAAVTLAACASSTSQSTLLRLSTDRRFRGDTAQHAVVTATLDDLPAILFTGLLTFFGHRSLVGLTVLPGIVWLALALALGLFGGWVIKILLERAESNPVRLLVVLGCLSIGGGLTAYMHLSPIFVGAAMGVSYVNFAARDEKVFSIVTRSESTLYVLFLILIGGMLKPSWENLLFFVPLYLGLRILAKLAGGALFRVRSKEGPKPSRLIGLALLSQGGMAIALAIHYRNLYASPVSDGVVTLVILGVAINQLFAAPLALWVAQRGRA